MSACLRPVSDVADSQTSETAIAVVHSSLGEFDVLRSTHLRQRFAPHMHDHWAIGVIESGCNRLRYRGRDFLAGAGSLVVIPPGEMHTGEPVNADGWSYRMAYPAMDVVRRAIGDDLDPGAPGAFPEPVVADNELAERFRVLHAALLADGGSADQDESLVTWLRALFERHACVPVTGTARRACSRAVQLVRAYIEAHSTELIRLATLADLAGVTPFQLIRMCNRELGMSPYAYVKQLRVQRAQQLLQRGMAVSHVAYEVGFSDQSHLTRTFKCVLGVTPGVYARACGQRTAGMELAAAR